MVLEAVPLAEIYRFAIQNRGWQGKIAEVLCVFQGFLMQPAVILAAKLDTEAFGTASSFMDKTPCFYITAAKFPLTEDRFHFIIYTNMIGF
ncbi:MAG: hypothetical protein HFE97_11375 [Oscillospiraceae bacterium]|nr:hypothetical protein [Oscillospiraceae bacterium]